MNSVILSGRLAADPIIDEGERPRCRFRLAVDAYNPSTKQREADFFSIVAFGKTAEIVGQYCHKGSYVSVRCHLKPRQWTDAKTGDRKYDTSIIVDEVELGPRASGEQPARQADRPTEPAPTDSTFDFEDLPF